MAPQKTKLSGEGNENHHYSKILFLLRYSSNFPCSSIYFSNDTSEIFHLSVVSIGSQHCETTCSKQAQAELRRAHVLKIIWENYETLLWISGPPSISHHNLQAYPNLDSHFKESWNAFFRTDNGGKKKKNYSDHSDRNLEERCCFPAPREANTESKVKRKEKLWSSWASVKHLWVSLRMLGTRLHSAFSHEWSASFHSTQTTFCQTYHTWWLLGNWREITFERFHFPRSLCGKGLKIALGVADTGDGVFRDCKWLYCCNLGNLAPWFVV